ncbi:hypothetical protein R3P38DRAFT_948130 [Favolaschia claudopus]|uniref:Uncharacterized protein n=1 Tax=Favolaschia claudopus TaxID=2862362 RepID=A0AAW0BM11_9AGAR
MEDESDSQEACTKLSSNILVDQSVTTLNVSGGIGGQGGGSGQEGGAGGNGEGPTLNVSGAAGWIVHINDGSALRNSSTLVSAIDSAPPPISVCDINLQQEVYLDDSRILYQRRRRDVVRRYCSAQVKDRREMTVVVYEGQDAEEELKRDVAQYMKFRHPSFFQLYGIVRSENLHASIFYEALIPWMDIETIYRQSPMVVCYIYASIVNDFCAASDYYRGCFGSPLSTRHCTLFLRPSTGQLCIDLGGPDISTFYVSLIEAQNISPMSLLSTIDTQIIIDGLPIEQYHKICDRYSRDNTYTEFPLTATVHLGAVYDTTGYHDLGNPIVTAPTLDTDNCLPQVGWSGFVNEHLLHQHITESGWNRFAVSELIGIELGENIHFSLSATSRLLRNSDLWFSQANHILNRLFSNADNYALLHSVHFTVQLKPQSAQPADWHSLNGFLFLCPPQSFRVGPASFKCPKCVGYWSLDSSGVGRLSVDQASELGFPTIRVSISGSIDSWIGSVYTGLRQFHQAKGFNPDTQDLARHLDYALYGSCPDHDNFMDVDDDDFGAHIEEVSSTDTDQPMDID